MAQGLKVTGEGKVNTSGYSLLFLYDKCIKILHAIVVVVDNSHYHHQLSPPTGL